MLWDDFLNSDYHDWKGGDRSEDRLDKPGWLGHWLADHGLSDPGTPSPEEVGLLKELRQRMLGIVRSVVAGKPVQSADIDALNDTLAGGPAIQRLQKTDAGYRMDASPLRHDWPSVRADIAASFARMLAEGETSRLGICDNPDCLWVFYDETRNRSKRFCNDKMCGNLVKVRRFRARQKAGKK